METMNIRVCGQRFEDGVSLEVEKRGKVLILNGEEFDFSPMLEGSTLPVQAINSDWFVGDASCSDGAISIHLRYPIPFNFSPEQATPQDLLSVPDGDVLFPAALPDPFAQGDDNE